MKRIAIPTDFSVESDKAIALAKHLALAYEAEIHFVHIIEPFNGVEPNMTGYIPETGPDYGVFFIKLMEVTKKDLNKRVNSSDLMGITTHGDIRYGDFFPTLKHFVQEHGIDFVVMGSKGASGIDEVLIGSNAERVMRLLPVPVIITKHSMPEYNLQHLVVATNGDDSELPLLVPVKNLAEKFGSTIHLLNVNTPNNFYRTSTMEKILGDFAQKAGLSQYEINIYNDTVEEDGILEFAQKINADLIAIGTHARSGLSRFLAGSVSEEVVNAAQIPVLTVKVA